jgi:WD40 repeat protein
MPDLHGYEVTREVARGGMGVVYAARDTTFDRTVAIKVMHPGQDAGRFIIESKVTARLPHPGVPPVYALGALADGRPFLAMKLIDGCTLADELTANREAALPHLVGVFEQICLTVGFAHARGIIHRDLKPSNVMVGRFGEVLVMDWGLAKELDGPADGAATEPLIGAGADQFQTVAGQVKGTPAYMAPEQARGEPVDARADVFALGGLLAVLLTGEPPFRGDTVLATVLKAAEADLDRCFDLLESSGIDEELIDVAQKCLAEHPADRFADGAAVAAAVAAYRLGVEKRLRKAEAARAAARARIAEQRKRRQVQLALGCAVAFILGLLGVGMWWQIRQADRRKLERSEADAREARSESERLALVNDAEVRNAQNAAARARVEAEARKTVQRQVIDLCAASGLRAEREGDHALALLWFARAVRLAGDAPEQQRINRVRITNWLNRVPLPVGAFTVPGFRERQDRFQALAFSPDGRYLLAGAGSASAVWDCASKRLVPLDAAPNRSALAWRPDGLLAVASADQTIRFLAPPEFKQVGAGLATDGPATALAFSRDGQRLAWGGPKGARVWDLKAEEPVTALLTHPQPVATVAFSGSGLLLATGARDSKARVFRVAANVSEPLYPPVPHALGSPNDDLGEPDQKAPRFADDDQFFLTLERQENVFHLVWRAAETGEVRASRSLPARVLPNHPTAFAVSPKGNRVAAGAWESDGFLWDAANQNPLAPIRVGRYSWFEDMCFTADGKTIVTSGYDRMVRFWHADDWADGSLARSEPSILHPANVVRVQPSPDGRHVAVAAIDGGVYLWALSKGPPTTFQIPAGGTTLPRLSPNGSFILPGSTSFRGATQTKTRVHDAVSGAPAGPVLDPGGLITEAVFSPDGARVALAVLTAQNPDERNGQIFEPDGKSGSVQVWDWKTGQRLADSVPMPSEPRGLAFHPDGQTLVAVCADYRVVLVDLRTQKVTRTLDPGVRSHPLNANSWTANGNARFSSDGRFLVTWELGTKAHVWDPARGVLLHTLTHSARIEEVDFHPTRSNLLVVPGAPVSVWDLETGRTVAQLPHPAHVIRTRFSADGSEILTAAYDGTLRAWDWRAGKLKEGLPLHPSLLMDFGLVSDRWLVTLGMNELQVSDWRDKSPVGPLWNLRNGTQLSLAIPSGGRRAVVGGFSRSLVGYDLGAMTVPNELPADEILAFAELVAGRRILDSGNVVSLTGEEWADRWQRVQQGATRDRFRAFTTFAGAEAPPAVRPRP